MLQPCQVHQSFICFVIAATAPEYENQEVAAGHHHPVLVSMILEGRPHRHLSVPAGTAGGQLGGRHCEVLHVDKEVVCRILRLDIYADPAWKFLCHIKYFPSCMHANVGSIVDYNRTLL